eukprot:TRINITY_DN20569_c0_g1_i7.p1 TRINITY_DN20569_c0_g1~~TRINITY_DN20569_c0_g1_i7.p1  ORF type:complete len:630 (-),score=151.41 TRINITY_DN20569_c0_g1_i7:421-2310(-)
MGCGGSKEIIEDRQGKPPQSAKPPHAVQATPQPAQGHAGVQNAQSQSPNPVQQQQPAPAEQVYELPEGWKERQDRRTGATYWVHTETKERTTRRPRHITDVYIKPIEPVVCPASVGAELPNHLIGRGRKCVKAVPSLGSKQDAPFEWIDLKNLEPIFPDWPDGSINNRTIDELNGMEIETTVKDSLDGVWRYMVSDGKAWFISQTDYEMNEKFDRYGFNTELISKLDFQTRVEWFRHQLGRSVQPGHLDVAVHRENIFQDSVVCISAQDKSRLLSSVKVVFEGETKLLNDASGIKKSWMDMLSKYIFGESGLFEYDEENEEYKIDRTARYKLSNFEAGGKKYNHLELLTFVGRLLGKVLFDGERLPLHLSQSIYKALLQQETQLEDVRDLDPGLFKVLNGVRNGEQEYHPDYLCEVFGALEMVPNRETGELELTDVEIGRIGGCKIDMTMENRVDWVEYKFHWALRGRIKDELDKLLYGFWSVVNPALLSIFSAPELQMLLCGNMELDLDDWQASSSYEGGFSPDHQVVQWFWEVMAELEPHEHVKLLQFVTGSQTVPLEGFRGLANRSGPFTLKRVKHGTKATGGSSMPIGHTCTNTMDLPDYPDKQTLGKMLKVTIELGMQSQFIME